MTTVVSNNKQSPEHCSLSKPVQWPHKRVVQSESAIGEGGHNTDIQGKIGKGSKHILLKAFFWNSLAQILKRKWWGVG